MLGQAVTRVFIEAGFAVFIGARRIEGWPLWRVICATRLVWRRRCGRVAYLSSLVMRYQGTNGFDWRVFRAKQRAVQLIRESGIPYSIFYPSNFIKTLLHTQRVGPFVLVLGQSDVRPHFIAACDYCRQVMRALPIAGAGQDQE